MIVHVLRLAFREGVSTDDVDRGLAILRRTASLPAVSFSFVGQDLGNPADGYTHAYCVGIPDLDALDRYLSDPTHRAGDFELVPLIGRLGRVDMSDDMDRGLSDAIFGMHRQKMERDPEWATLLGTIPDVRL